MNSIIPNDLPTAEQIAEELKRMLYVNSIVPDEEMAESEARVLSIRYCQFYAVAKRKKLAESLYHYVRWAGWEIGINIGFGVNGVVIATDADHYIRWEQPL